MTMEVTVEERNKLIARDYQLIRNCARFLFRRCPHVRMNRQLDDVVSECVLGYIKALRTWKPEVNNNFEYWAKKIIRQYVSNICREDKMIRVPMYNYFDGNTEKENGQKALAADSIVVTDKLSHIIENKHSDDFTVLNASLSKLSKDKANLISRYYGIDQERQTLQQIGDTDGVSYEMIRKRLGVALKSLRNIYENIEI